MKSEQVSLVNAEYLINSEEVPINIKDIGCEILWNKGYKGKDVVIAILDTGCDTNHPDLSDRILDGYNFTKDYSSDTSNYNDNNGHGTHAAGIIAGSENKQGIIGVSPEASLLVLKVLNSQGTGSTTDLIKAVDYSINWRGNNGEKVRIISLSLSLKFPNDKLREVIKKAIENNISVVVAAGNNGDGEYSTKEYSYPSAYPEVISVGAINHKKDLAYFTNINKEIDLYAPGVDINSSYLNGEYQVMSGTSMAAPHVAGVLALLINEYNDIFNKKVSEKDLYELLMLYTTTVQIKDQEKISILDLRSKKMEIKHETLIKCYCESRKNQAFYTKCLNDAVSIGERDFLIELIKKTAITSNQIRKMCSKY